MVSERDRRHILLPKEGWRTREGYTPHGGGSSKPIPEPPLGRPKHGASLTLAIEDAAALAAHRREETELSVHDAVPGTYLAFESFPGLRLALESMESRRSKDPQQRIELVAVSETPATEAPDAQATQRATIFVPDGKLRFFLERLEKYGNAAPKTPGERRHENVFDRIADVRLAALRALWTDDDAAYPARDDLPIWWEVWLRRTDGDELTRLATFCTDTGVTLSARHIMFDDRIVTLVRAASRDLAASLDVMGDLAEVRRAKDTPTFFIRQSSSDVADWVRDLVDRTEAAGADAPRVCLLDTGVNAGHPLLNPSLVPEDRHALDLEWGTHDNGGGPEQVGHGTMMAGLALYGDLTGPLAGSHPIRLRHRLESVKILPPTGSHDPELYGAITAEATARPEVSAPSQFRVFSMAITAPDARDRGQPTSWSAAIDALAAGRSLDAGTKSLTYVAPDEEANPRLFVLSAGNVAPSSLERSHLDRSDTEPVHDPAQAWNALTVGAFTEKVVISDPDWRGWSPVAERGELSPWSTTSVPFQPRWPVKPEVVFEGGNVVYDADENVDYPCDDLCLLSTHRDVPTKPLETVWATSASTAQAARLCATLAAEYPNLWPEAIRALVVHSGRWTDAMQKHFSAASGRRARGMLLRRYGYGVPSQQRALRSASNAATLIAQDVIHPFLNKKMNEVHFHDLPWPGDALRALGHTAVKVRVTLSYFVEPNPSRRGWRTRHRYQSHALRFELKGPTETRNEFRKRLNQRALDSDEDRPTDGKDNDGWYLGPYARNGGSIHSDVLEGTAEELAARGSVAVYPVGGWWKELPGRDRSDKGARYALVVSVDTDAVGVDLWTPIATQVGVPIAIVT